jgi:hypothetical protein
LVWIIARSTFELENFKHKIHFFNHLNRQEMKKGLQLLLICLIAKTNIGQTTINTTGGHATINGQTHEYSIGEVVVQTATGSNFIISQGLLQPKKSTPATGAVSSLITDQQLQLFPVPTANILNLQSGFERSGTLNISVYDMSGKMILQKDFLIASGKELNQMNLNEISEGNYTIHAEFKSSANSSLVNVFQLTKLR